MSFRTHVIQSVAKDLENINASYYCHSERSEGSECINVDVIHTPLSPLSRGEEIKNHKSKNHLRRR